MQYNKAFCIGGSQNRNMVACQSAQFFTPDGETYNYQHVSGHGSRTGFWVLEGTPNHAIAEYLYYHHNKQQRGNRNEFF